MARGDAEFCRWETEFAIDDPRFVTLSPAAKALYVYLWALAVRKRSEHPRGARDLAFIALRANLAPSDIEQCLRELRGKKHHLIKARKTRDGTWSITVCGVRSKHPKLMNWNGSP